MPPESKPPVDSSAIHRVTEATTIQESKPAWSFHFEVTFRRLVLRFKRFFA
jgi:hypothetical protein